MSIYIALLSRKSLLRWYECVCVGVCIHVCVVFRQFVVTVCHGSFISLHICSYCSSTIGLRAMPHCLACLTCVPLCTYLARSVHIHQLLADWAFTVGWLVTMHCVVCLLIAPEPWLISHWLIAPSVEPFNHDKYTSHVIFALCCRSVSDRERLLASGGYC